MSIQCVSSLKATHSMSFSTWKYNCMKRKTSQGMCVSECVDFAVDQHQSVLVRGVSVCVCVSAAAVSQLTACTQHSRAP